MNNLINKSFTLMNTFILQHVTLVMTLSVAAVVNVFLLLKSVYFTILR